MSTVRGSRRGTWLAGVLLVAGCGVVGSPAARPSTSTGELTAEEACRNSHGISLGSARRVGSVVRLMFGDGARDPRPVVYRVHRRPADRSRPWTAVADVRRAPAERMVWTDATAPPVALLYGVTIEGICGDRSPSPADADPGFFVLAPAVSGSPASD